MSKASNTASGPDRFIDLPDIRFEGVLQNGTLYYRSEDVEKWLRETVKVARAEEIPIEVAIFVAGMLDSLKRARSKSGLLVPRQATALIGADEHHS